MAALSRVARSDNVTALTVATVAVQTLYTTATINWTHEPVETTAVNDTAKQFEAGVAGATLSFGKRVASTGPAFSATDLRTVAAVSGTVGTKTLAGSGFLTQKGLEAGDGPMGENVDFTFIGLPTLT